MKEFISEYVHIIASTVIGLVFGIAFYYLLLNAFHQSTMARTVYMNAQDKDIVEFQNNMKSVENLINNFDYHQSKKELDMVSQQTLNGKFMECQNLYKKDILYSVKDSKEIGYVDVNDMNENLINNYIDGCFIKKLLWFSYEDKIKDTSFSKQMNFYYTEIKILSNNSLYIKKELKDNSNYYLTTDIANSTIRNKLASSYQQIISNYKYFSEIYKDIANSVYGG